MALPGSYSLKWHGHGVHLNSSISGLYRSDAFTDVVVATADGRYFSAHQFVLSACSPYLHKMFLIGSKANAKTVIVLPSEIGHTTLSILLQYIYRGEAIVSHDQLPHIMNAAEILEIRGLCQGKEKQDDKNSRNVLKQQNKNSQVLLNNSEVIKPNHIVLIPEVNYGSELPLSSNDAGANNGCTSGPLLGKTSRNISSTIKRSPSIMSSPLEKKKQKVHPERSLIEHNADSEVNIEDSMIEKIIVGEEIHVKEEPVDWDEPKSSDGNGANVKQEIVSEEEVEVEESCYVALTCDLCQETFNSPALWVRHIEETHPTTALASGKRSNVDDDSGQEGYTPLHCELCQQVFSIPADWVRHIKTHTEEQLAQNNESADTLLNRQRVQIACPVCGKVLQSQASMQIHARTHTGERPYLCKVCGREFNVKSNFLRHMRTLHDLNINSNSVE